MCSRRAAPAGTASSPVDGRRYRLARCDGCGFAFVVEPRTDFSSLYDDDYYRGHGADGSVDYAAELEDRRTIRRYEWDGVLATVRRLRPARIDRWLDFGCGYGGLVRHLRGCGIEAYGFDEGIGATRAAAAGIPIIDRGRLGQVGECFDVITAVEVLEHVLDPVGVLRSLSGLLNHGGVLFVTTGNSAPHRARLASWSYVVPDVHISFFEPRTLRLAYEAAGLEPRPVGYGAGSREIIRYKVLKAMRRRRRSTWEHLVPWGLVARIIDQRLQITSQPAAVRSA